WRERDPDVRSAAFRGLLNCGVAAKDDEVRQRNFLAAGLRLIELLLDGFQFLQHVRELSRTIHFPILLRGESNARTIGSAAFIGTAECGRGSPRCSDELRDGDSRLKDLRFERGGVL